MKIIIERGTRRLITTLAFWIAVILVAVNLDISGHVESWVAQIAIAIAFGRICFISGWGFAKCGWGWRV